MMGPVQRSRPLPPLNSLRVFEAAARYGSFSKAAEALSVTPGAVSRSIKMLEDYIQAPLFIRTATGLELTHASKNYAIALTDALARIEEATESFVVGRRQDVLTILAYFSFIQHWLLPRLPHFQISNPSVEVMLIGANDKAVLSRTAADVRIRYGDGNWGGLESLMIFQEELAPVCSPRILDPANVPYNAEILGKLDIIHVNFRRADWKSWLDLASSSPINPKNNLYFEEMSVVYQSAIAGLGLALGQRAVIRNEIQTGRLFEPFNTILTRSKGYYLTYEKEKRDFPKIAAFREWIQNVKNE
jgi:LysR family transcriptional regulator, glycine cleavage system transcriptional activator